MKRSSLTARSSVRMSLKWKTILVCLILLIVPGLLIGAMGYRTAKQELDESGKINLRDNVQMTIALIDAYQGMVKKGAITLEEAQEQVRARAVGPKKEDGKSRAIERKIGDTGYIFALDDKGTDVMHPSREGENVWESRDSTGMFYVQEIIKNGTAEGGYTYYENPLPGTDKIARKVTYSQLEPHWGWVVAAGAYVQDFDRGSSHILDVILYTLLGFTAVGIVMAVLFARHLTRPIARITEQVEQLAAGNLILEELKVKNRDEVGSLARHFHLMKLQMRELIGRVSESAEQVAASSEELLAGSEETSKATEQITLAVQEVASGANQQAEVVMEIFNLVTRVEEGMSEIASGSEQATLSSVQASLAAETGNQVISETLHHMRQIEEKVARLERAILTLEEKSAYIGEIITMITQISAQTNILALNASIEASRAGDQGKGFMVVATEVKKLAEQTRNAADQIGGLVYEIQQEVAEASSAMREEAEAVASGLSLASKAEGSFRNIAASVTGVVERSKAVADVSGDVIVRMSSLVSAVEQIAAISAQTAGQSEGVAASAEEQNAAMEEIAAAATQLSRMADELKETVSAFQISDR